MFAPYRKYVLSAFCFMLLLPGCSKESKKSAARPPVPVVVSVAATTDIPQRLQAVGTVEAGESVIIRPQITGELASVYAAEGQDVVKGQKLFLIDPRPWQVALKRAEAALSRNRVIMENARRDYERYSQLVKDGIVTHEQAEGYRTRAESAAADMEADQAMVENARLQLAYCSITAPISGRLGNLSVHKGNVVEAAKTPMVTLNSISPVNVNFAIPEKELSEVRMRMAQGRLEVLVEAQGAALEKGAVTFLDNMVDPSTGAIRLKAAFTNNKRTLWPGQFVQVVLNLSERKGVVAIPSQAIQTGQQGSYLFVIKQDMTAELRNVTLGAAHQGLTAIEKGLAAGEQVVVDGQIRVVPGKKVEIIKPNEKPADQSGKS